MCSTFVKADVCKNLQLKTYSFARKSFNMIFYIDMLLAQSNVNMKNNSGLNLVINGSSVYPSHTSLVSCAWDGL